MKNNEVFYTKEEMILNLKIQYVCDKLKQNLQNGSYNEYAIGT